MAGFITTSTQDSFRQVSVRINSGIVRKYHFPDLKSSVKRRGNYALKRDLLAEENNEAIGRLLVKNDKNNG